jgi:hypothetical protein
MSEEADKIMGSIGKKPAIVFAFDTTGSMSSCIDNVRRNIKELAEKLFEEIPGLKMGLIAHGDYCDGNKCYQQLDLTSEIGEIINFIEKNHNTSGGDSDECYEYVLQRAIELSWPEDGGTLVMIGDCAPHDETYYANFSSLSSAYGGRFYTPTSEVENPEVHPFIDWQVELSNLKARNIEVFGVQCMKMEGRARENQFWEGIGQIAGTPLIIMDNFQDSYQTLGSITRATLSDCDETVESFVRTASCSVANSASYGENVSKLSAYRTKKFKE